MKKILAISMILLTLVSILCSCGANEEIAAAAAKADNSLYKYTLLWPTNNTKFRSSSSFGYRTSYKKFHYGIDIDGGGDILAAESGTVLAVYTCTHDKKCSCNHDYGNGVVIYHDELNIITTYAHMKSGSVTVKNGDHVSAGQKIGTMGQTGNADGVHLHFEIINESEKENVKKTGYVKSPPKEVTDPDPNSHRFNPMPYVNKNSDSKSEYSQDAFITINSNYVGTTYERGDIKYVKTVEELIHDECLTKKTTDINKNGKVKNACQFSNLPHDPEYNKSAGVDSKYIDGAKIPKGATIKLISMVNNGHNGKAGNDWYKAEYNGFTGYIWKGNVEIVAESESSTSSTKAVTPQMDANSLKSIKYYNSSTGAALTLNGGTLPLGTGVRIDGTVKCNVKMSKVYFVANKYNSSTKKYDISAMSAYEDVNSTSYTFRKAGSSNKTYLNYKLSFKNLGSGSYQYEIYAITSTNSRLSIQTGTFKVAEPTISFSPSFQLYNGSKYVAFTLNNNTKPYNKSCSVQGKLTSTGKKIVAVKANIQTSNGTTKCSKEMAVSASYNVTLSKGSAIDNAMTFKSLAKGNYKFNLYVKLEGESSYRTVATYSFKVA